MKKRMSVIILACLLLLSACTVKNQDAAAMPFQAEATTASTNEEPKDPNWHIAKLVADGEPYWTFIDQEGNSISETKWQYAEPFSAEGLARVTQTDLVGLIGLDGSVVVEPSYSWIGDFNEGLAVCNKVGLESDVIDASGKVLFSHGGLGHIYYQGLIQFSTPEGLTGFLDKSGKVVIEPTYSQAEDFKYGKALAKTAEHSYVLLDPQGNRLKTFDYEFMRSAGEDMFVFGKTQLGGGILYGYMTMDGRVILDAQYDDVGDFIEGLAVVGQWKDYVPSKGIINAKGEWVVPMTYGALESLGHGYFAAIKETAFDVFQALAYEKSALIDSKGQALTGEAYYNLTRFDEEQFSASDGINTFLLDRSGSPSASKISVMGIGTLYKEGDLIRAEVDNHLAYYDLEGRLIWAEDARQVYPEVTITKTIKRLGRFVLIEYPRLSEVKSSGVAEKINEKLYALMVRPTETREGDEAYPADTQISYTPRLFGHVLEIETTYYEYGLGAAHGNWMTQTTFYDLQTGETYTLPQLFLKDSEYGKVLGAEIRKEIPSTEYGDYLDLEPIDAIDGERSFRLQDNGIEIYFNPYEIAPYAAGQPSFLIPWEALDTILEKNGAFWKAIKG